MQRLRIRRRPGTIAVAAAIQRHYDIHVVPHILCSGYTREDTEYMLLDLQFLGISDLLVLRGDKAKEDPAFRPTGDGYSHATELIGTSTVSMTVSSSTVRPSSLPAHRFHTVWLAIRKNMRKHPIRKPTWPCSSKKPTWVPHTPSPSCSTTMRSISTLWTVHAEPASPSPSSRASSRLPNCHNSA